MVIPAVSGPYDLGNIAIRVAIAVDPTTTQVTAISDPLPQILEGIPLRTRMVELKLDRPSFAINPTNCGRSGVEAGFQGTEAAAVDQTAGFQVANCADLPFRPMLTMRLSGGVRRQGHPAVHALLKMKPGEANIRKVSVALPKGQLLDNSHIQTICTRVSFAAESCPAGSRIGHAEVVTPLLDCPLTGSIYLRASSSRLPDLAIDLRGQIDITLTARIDSIRGRLRATFMNVPDARVSTVRLDLSGGKKGLLINGEDLCKEPRRPMVELNGQNGRHITPNTKLQIPCGLGASGKRHGRRPLAEARG